jgi:hypothetical protein
MTTAPAAKPTITIESGTPYGPIRIDTAWGSDTLVLKQQGVSDGTHRIDEIAIAPGMALALGLALLETAAAAGFDVDAAVAAQQEGRS